MPELAVSTWSLHRSLGAMYPRAALDAEPAPDLAYGPGRLALLDAPEAVAALGIRHLEVCHFHFPRTDPAYLAAFRERLAAAEVRFLTLLVDTGDISSPDPATRERDIAGIRRWIEIAAEAGAARVRVVAGESPPDPERRLPEDRSVAALAALRDHAAPLGVEVITENWRALTQAPDALLYILDGVGEGVGLCADFGNYTGPGKYGDLARILPRAVTVHAKAEYPRAGEMDAPDYARCLDLARDAGFSGHHVLIFDGPGDEVASLAEMAGFVRPYL